MKREREKPSFSQIGLVTVLRYSLLALLTLASAGYLASSASKYSRGRMGVSTAERPATAFEFPSVAVCVTIKELVVGQRLIQGVSHDFILEGNKLRARTYRNGTVAVFRGEDEDEEEEDVGEKIDVDWNQGEAPIIRDFMLVDNHGRQLQCTIYMAPKGILTQYSLYNEMIVEIPESELYREIGRPFWYIKTGYSSLMVPFAEILGNSDFIVEAKNNTIRDVRLKIEFGEYTSLRRTERECSTDERLLQEVDMMECFNQYMTGRVPCYNNGIPLATCTKEDERAIQREVKRLYEGGENEYLRTIGCRPPCTIPTYDVSIAAVFEKDAPPGSGSGVLRLVFHSPKPSMTVKEEFLMYDQGNLAGDVGGMVGMLLGASIFGLYNSLQEILLSKLDRKK